jgi:hypothetical protein
MKKILFLIVLLSSIITRAQIIGSNVDVSNLVIKNAPITASTNTKITYDSKGLVISGTSLTASDVPILNQNTSGTASTITGTITQSQVTGLATDLSGKVDKVAGKSLLSDSEITRLSTLSNYTHPATHPPSIIAQDPNNRFVTDAEKAVWNNSQSTLPAISAKTSSYTLTSSDSTVLFDTSTGNLTATLPDASSLKGKIFSIRKSDLKYNTLSFSPPLKSYGSDVTVLNYQKTIRVQSDGSNWIIIE